MTAVPRSSSGCASRMAMSVLSAMDSTKPLPNVLVDIRNARMLSSMRYIFDDVRMSCARMDQATTQGFVEPAALA